MTENNEGILVTRVNACEVCDKRGEVLFENLRDSLFNAPGDWSLLRCRHCRRAWLNPRPIQRDIGKLYEVIYFHSIDDDGIKPGFSTLRRVVRDSILATRFRYVQLARNSYQRIIGHIISLVWFLRDAAELSSGCLDGRKRGSLLDVGYGTGAFLARMNELGWDVMGVEPDTEALRMARSHFGLDVHQRALEDMVFRKTSLMLLQ